MADRKIHWYIALPLLLQLAGTPCVHAFHDGGVGNCDGCHTVHNSSAGSSKTYNVTAPGRPNAYLLLATDPSSTCLVCHQVAGDVGPTAYHVSTPEGEMPAGYPPKQLSPGGDFGWLKKSYSWYPAVGQPASTSIGERHGHNIVSGDFGYVQDSVHAAAPGGTYPSASLSCISCHDPHGKYRRRQDGTVGTSGGPIKSSGSDTASPDPDAVATVGSYRLLGGMGYYPKSPGNAYGFAFNAPAAVAPATSNRSEATSVTRVGYGSGMTEWCKNCHTNMHNAVYTGNLTHVAGVALDATLIANYNNYVKSGDVSGMMDSAYSSLVPFEIGTSNYAVLKGIVTTTPAKGPDTADGAPAVMCLTCHRAHASGWDAAVRWNSKSNYIVYNGAYSEQNQVYQPYGQGRTEAEASQAYYNTPLTKFANMQQSLCNKCHVNDLQ